MTEVGDRDGFFFVSFIDRVFWLHHVNLDVSSACILNGKKDFEIMLLTVYFIAGGVLCQKNRFNTHPMLVINVYYNDMCLF